MASPLTIKQPSAASHVQQYLLVGLLFLPMIYLRYLKSSGGMIHYTPPLVNLFAHAAIILLPLSVAYTMVYKPFEFRDSDETILEPQTFWTTLTSDWWMFFMLWSSPFLALLALLYEAPHLVSNAALWMTGPGSAFLTMLLAFAFSFIFGTIVRGRTQTRISGDGLRNGLVNFYEWENIDHISIENDIFGIYHRVNPSLPYTFFKLQNAENRRLLLTYLDNNKVRQSRGPEPFLLIVKFCVVAATGILIALGIWLYLTTNIDLRWLLIGVFVASIGTTMVLEVVRGVAKVTKTKPLVELETVEAVSGLK